MAGEDFDADELVRLSSALFDQSSLVQDLNSRIEILRLKVAAEAAQQRHDKRAADWEALNPLLMKRASTACKVGNAIREVADLVRQLNQQTVNITDRFLHSTDSRFVDTYLHPPGELTKQIAAVTEDTINDWISEIMTGHELLKTDWHHEAPVKTEEAA